MFCRYRHHCNGMLFVNFCYLTSCISSEAVSTIEQFFNIHFGHIVNNYFLTITLPLA